MSWYLAVWKKYAVFAGRARRKEYWYFALFNVLIVIALGIIDSVTGTFSPQGHVGLLSGLYCLAVLIPALAVSVRRLHDTNRSGWWLLLALVPLAGAVVLLVFYAQGSKAGENEHGPHPKAMTPEVRVATASETASSSTQSASPPRTLVGPLQAQPGMGRLDSSARIPKV